MICCFSFQFQFQFQFCFSLTRSISCLHHTPPPHYHHHHHTTTPPHHTTPPQRLECAIAGCARVYFSPQGLRYHLQEHHTEKERHTDAIGALIKASKLKSPAGDRSTGQTRTVNNNYPASGTKPNNGGNKGNKGDTAATVGTKRKSPTVGTKRESPKSKNDTTQQRNRKARQSQFINQN